MSVPATLSLTRRQKAAVIAMAVGFDRAAPVIGQLTDEEQEQLAVEVAKLGEVSSEQLEAILHEFIEEAYARGHIVHGSLDAARELLRQTRGERAEGIIDRLIATVRVAPFRFLRDRDPEELAQHLSEEHPQTVALVLSHLPSGQAAAVLADFEPASQRDVAMRVARMGSPSPEVVRQVEDALKARLGDHRTTRQRSEEDGIRELASILNSTDRGTEKEILSSLESDDPQLAEQVRELMFIFEDIVKLDDRALQRVLREVEQETLLYALKGVAEEVSAKVMRNISERAATALTEELEVLGPVRIAEVESAQSEVVRTIRRLEESGDIIVRRGGEGGDVID